MLIYQSVLHRLILVHENAAKRRLSSLKCQQNGILKKLCTTSALEFLEL